MRRGNFICLLFYPFITVFHGDAYPALLKHGNIIKIVPNTHHFMAVNIQLLGNQASRLTFAGSLRRYRIQRIL